MTQTDLFDPTENRHHGNAESRIANAKNREIMKPPIYYSENQTDITIRLTKLGLLHLMDQDEQPVGGASMSFVTEILPSYQFLLLRSMGFEKPEQNGYKLHIWNRFDVTQDEVNAMATYIITAGGRVKGLSEMTVNPVKNPIQNN
jgi:hypothetical protein